MKYAYMRGGAPLLRWSQAAPKQSRAGETQSLGSLGGTTLDNPTLVLPRPGAPEPIGVSAMGGCGCHGSCGCGTGMGGIADAVPGGYLTLGAVALLAWQMLRKRGRR